ncbi:MAG: sigma-54-dependent Fis family transcriptional regulator [Pirellulaceae bacterium]|nr:sigma-54-dependent Fis family transcriptional regulator [Pirellulaceae bacterium]
MNLVLLVDDEEAICWGLKRIVERLGAMALVASSVEEALSLSHDPAPEVIVLDVRLPGMDGMTAMPLLRAKWPSAKLIMITAFGDLETAVQAVRNGAFDYVVKPFEGPAISKVIARGIAAANEKHTGHDGPKFSPAVGGFIGHSSVMQSVYAKIALAADSDAGVLLIGESGSGKEIAARALHRFSNRADGPFIPVHIASLSPELLASELFGHVRGAFTGADDGRRGLLAQADRGTLFLDEVAEIPLAIQVKLLRALEQKEVWPVGANAPLACDFRIISATHQDLQAMIEQAMFRHDLFFRIASFQIELPPLRARPDDIEPLATHFLASLSQNSGKKFRLSGAAVKHLISMPWYGNVRELRNALEHAAILSRGETILPDHFPPPVQFLNSNRPKDFRRSLTAIVQDWARFQLNSDSSPTELQAKLYEIIEPVLFQEVLMAVQGNVSEAARLLGIHRTTLKRKLEESDQIQADNAG